MTASELFQAGRLQDAIAAQVAKVKAHPGEQAARFFLFELLMFTGDLDRARKQLDALKYDDPQHTAAVAHYRNAIDAESRRRAVFAGTEQPSGLTVSPDHLKLRLEAIGHSARGEHTEARQKLDAAIAATPLLRGQLNGKQFHGIGECDERFGTILEVFGTGGVYSWVPLEAVRSIMMNPPGAPRDILFRPAQITLTDGFQGDVLIPGLYPSTFTTTDDELRLGQATDWLEHHGISLGIGAKQWLTDSGPVSLHDWQLLTLDEQPSS